MPTKTVTPFPHTSATVISEESSINFSESEDDLDGFCIISLQSDHGGSNYDILSLPSSDEFEIVDYGSVASLEDQNVESKKEEVKEVASLTEELSFTAESVGNSFISCENSNPQGSFIRRQELKFPNAEKPNCHFFTHMELNDQNKWVITTNRPHQPNDELILLKEGECLSTENEMKILFGKARPVVAETDSTQQTIPSFTRTIKQEPNIASAESSFWFFAMILDLLTSILSFITTFFLIFRT